MVATVDSTDHILTIWANLGVFLCKQFGSCFSLLEALDLLFVYVKLVAGLTFVPWPLVFCTSLKGAGLADHHGVIANLYLPRAAVWSHTHD